MDTEEAASTHTAAPNTAAAHAAHADTTCGACGKDYGNMHNLRAHLERQPLCADWLRLAPGVRDYVDDKFRLPQTDGEQAHDSTRCGVCGKVFANVGNLNRHLHASVACSKWAMYRDLHPLHAYVLHHARRAADAEAADAWDPSHTKADAAVYMAKMQREKERSLAADNDVLSRRFTPPEHTGLRHIIWNVFLADKELAVGTDFATTVKENNVKYVVAILPDAADYAARVKAKVDHAVLPYVGHEPQLDASAFDAQCARIEEHRRARGNVIVFCNSGYQRSLPFLCYYLRKLHPGEVPSVARAIDLILPQVDKANYGTLRAGYIETIGALLEPLGL